MSGIHPDNELDKLRAGNARGMLETPSRCCTTSIRNIPGFSEWYALLTQA